MQGAATSATTTVALAIHLRHDRRRGNTAYERMTVLAVGGDNGVVRLQGLEDADRHRLFTDVQMQEAADLALAVELRAPLLKSANAQHLPYELAREIAVVRNRVDTGETHAGGSSVEVSPSGNPSSRALSSLRMISPLRVRGSVATKSISLGATAAPRRLRAKPSSCMRNSSL